MAFALIPQIVGELIVNFERKSSFFKQNKSISKSHHFNRLESGRGGRRYFRKFRINVCSKAKRSDILSVRSKDREPQKPFLILQLM